MRKDRTIQPYIIKIEKDTNTAILFFPNDTSIGIFDWKIGCYVIIGGHSEATRDYMTKCCHFPKTDEETAKCNELVGWYGGRYNSEMVQRKRVNWRKALLVMLV